MLRSNFWLLIISLTSFVIGFNPKDSSHCIQWASMGMPMKIRIEGKQTNKRESFLCRAVKSLDSYDLSNDKKSCESDYKLILNKDSIHLPFGTIIDEGKACLPLHSAKVSDHLLDYSFQHAIIDSTCDVWWREVTADVIPPIPELTISFGTNSDGHKLGLCRTFGEEADIDDQRPIVGTFVLEGPDFGKCFFTKLDGSTQSLDGGMFHVLQARAIKATCQNDIMEQKRLLSQLKTLLKKYLPYSDRNRIEKISGHPFAGLQEKVLKLGSCELNQILSSSRFFPNALNTEGLHLLRTVLAERMNEARAREQEHDKHPDYLTWREHGLILKDFDAIGDEGLFQLFKIVSGENEDTIPLPPYQWTSRNISVSTKRDPQNDMHVDTFAQIVKIWIFEQGVTMEQGPLIYLRGSNRNTDDKLLWMYHYSLPPATEALREPSFRLLGCPAAVKEAFPFVTKVLEDQTPVLPLPGVKRTLVIADTSGLHKRGIGVPGHIRRSLRLVGDNDGGLKRLNPFRKVN